MNGIVLNSMKEKEFITVIPENIEPVEYEKVIEVSLEDTLNLNELVKEVKEKENEQ